MSSLHFHQLSVGQDSSSHRNLKLGSSLRVSSIPLNLDQISSGTHNPYQPAGLPTQLRKGLLGTRHSTHTILFILHKRIEVNTIVSTWESWVQWTWVAESRSWQLGKSPSIFTAFWGFPASPCRCVHCLYQGQGHSPLGFWNVMERELPKQETMHSNFSRRVLISHCNY